jgi:hypothetical protein
MGGVLGWDSFSQPWFVHDDEFGPISLMVHSSKSGQSILCFSLEYSLCSIRP